MDNSKACSKCKQIKTLSFFNKRASSCDGFRQTCRQCDAISRRAYRATGKEPKKLYSELSEEMKNKNRARSREWNKCNKNRRSLSMAKRRALLKNNGVYLVSPKDISKIYQSLCFYCGKAGGEIDHVIPLTKGGRHSIGNLVAACRSCNSSKNNLFLIEWKLKR
jgi:5-methylcytosine-specific restriction endonuclease McrA